ncbi:hypothetical protein [Sorangium sp. So ce1078]
MGNIGRGVVAVMTGDGGVAGAGLSGRLWNVRGELVGDAPKNVT